MTKNPPEPALLDRILAAARVGENDDWEFKSSKGGFPGSFWETYSAMANTAGGAVVFGATEKGGATSLDGLSVEQLEKHKKTLWDGLNNKGVASRNLLASSQVESVRVNSGWLLVIRIPQTTRKERPVYKGQNPFGGTFKRNHEGDYKCSDDEVRRMFADADDTPADARILDGFSIDDFDPASVRAFRNRFTSTRPSHVWVNVDDENLLEMMGATRRDRETGKWGVTLAGILMLGKHQAIISPGAAPSYFVDFRDYRGRQKPEDRWTDRLFPDGTWEANLFQFYTRGLPKLLADLKVPFGLRSGQRVYDSPVHVALQEAMVNALIHADYSVGGGIVIERHDDGYQFSNPGTLLVTEEQLRKGGVSECRNKTLQRMFINIGGGDQAGSGYARIQEGWKSAHWRAPRITTQGQPDRVRLEMPMISLIPEPALVALRKQFGVRFDRLSSQEVLAVATALIEDDVSNARMQDLVKDHPADITKILRGLVGKGFLVPENQRRWTRYALAANLTKPDLFDAHLPSKGEGKGEGRQTETGAPIPIHAPLPKDELEVLLARVRAKKRASKTEVERAILELCRERYLTSREIADALGRGLGKIRHNYLGPMVAAGLLRRLHTDIGHPEQAYITIQAP
jgi:ATP-dependent DNA helicase RecG